METTSRRRLWIAVCLLVVVSGVIGILGFTGGCGDEPSFTTTGAVATVPETAPAPEPEPEPEPSGPLVLKWGETAISEDGVEISVAAPVIDTANLNQVEREWMGTGKDAVYCLVTIINNSSESYSYNVYQFKLTDSTSMLVDDFPSTYSSQPGLSSGDLPPGRTLTGALNAVVLGGRTIGYVDFMPDMFSGIAASWGD